ncbi:hypothetical protein AB2063_000826 [Clostridium botulinum]
MKNLNLDKIDFKIYNSTVDKLDSMYFRNMLYYKVLYYWIKNNSNNKSISDYLLDNGVNSVAIYGAGNLGEILYDELKREKKILIKYIIDKSSSNSSFNNTPIFKPEEINSISKVDYIIITPIYAFGDIQANLKKLGIKNVICIDDIIFKIYEE